MSAPLRAHGVIALDPQACTSCMLCARECPDWCISIDSHSEEEAPAGRDALGAGARGRARVVHKLDSFEIDFGLCLWCGICVEVCPFDALFWAPVAARPGEVRDLVADAARLAGWREAVPAPQELEEGAVPPRPKDSGVGRGGGRRGR